jgi:hypothetical protein
MSMFKKAHSLKKALAKIVFVSGAFQEVELHFKWVKETAKTGRVRS